MATYVLVQGAWEGGWYWRPVADLLQGRGHRVFAPTLTGLGERAHLMSREIDLDTHIADVLGVLEFERLEDVVLVGHSYGGMVITGAADRAPERLRALVYLDAFLPEKGESLMDLALPERRARFEAVVHEEGEGWYIPPIPAAVWGIDDPDQAEWVDALSRPHPFATMTQRPSLSGAWAEIRPRHYILAEGYRDSPFAPIAGRLDGDATWTVHRLPGSHFLNLSHPQEVAAILEAAAG